MKTARFHAGMFGFLLSCLTFNGPAYALEEYSEATSVLGRIDAAAHFDADWTEKETPHIGWRPAELTPVNMYVQVQRWIRADTTRIAWSDSSELRLRSVLEVWNERLGSEMEKATVLLAGMRELGVRARPLVVCDDIERTVASSGGRILRDAILIEVDLPKSKLGERYGGRQVLDPGCSYCGFAEIRPAFHGHDALGLDDGRPRRTHLAIPDASANRVEHHATVEMSPPRRVGRPMSPGGFPSPDTIGIIPSMDYSVDQEIVVTGALRGSRVPTMKAVPLSMGVIRMNSPAGDPPDFMRGEGRSGQMCRLPGPDGTYRITDAVIDPLFLLADSTVTDSLRLPFAFEVVTVLTVPLQPSWQLVDLPEPVSFERPGLSFRLAVEEASDRYIRSLSLRVEKTMFVGEETRDFRDLARAVRGCSGRMGRIHP